MFRTVHILPVFLFSIFSCRQTNSPNSKGEVNRSVDDLYTRIEPYVFRQEKAEIKNILDSVKPLATDEFPRLKLFWLGNTSLLKAIDRDFDSSTFYLRKAEQVVKEHGLGKDDKLEIKVGLTRNWIGQRNYDSALQYALDAQYFSNQNGLHNPITKHHLFQIYDALGDQVNAKKYLLEGYKDSSNPPYLKLYFHVGLAKYYEENGMPDSALYFFQYLYHDTSYNNPVFKASKEENMGVLLTSAGRPAEGLPYILRAIPMLKKTGTINGLTFLNLSISYNKLNRFRQSLQFLDSIPLYEDTSKNIYLTRLMADLKGDNYSALGQPADAFHYKKHAFDLYKKEKDTLLAKNARELETKYQLREKEDKINTLATLNKKEAEITQQQKIIIVAISIVSFLVAIIGILLWKKHQTSLLIREANLQQQLLRSQMEPHFLFNTLSVLKSFIANENPRRAATFLDTFSSLLRRNLENARESFVPLNKEIQALRSYLDLHVMSFDNLFEYQLNSYFGSEEDPVLIPPMIIQPFVENAIIHGMAQYGKQSILIIKIDKRGEYIHCSIDDNGIGLQNSEQRGAKRSLSTTITKERLALLAKQFQRPAKIAIEDKQTLGAGSGVRVTLDIPFNNVASQQ